MIRLSSGQEVTFRTRKARCLLGLLLLAPGGRMNREQLASLLWDPAPEALARSSLRQALKFILPSDLRGKKKLNSLILCHAFAFRHLA